MELRKSMTETPDRLFELAVGEFEQGDEISDAVRELLTYVQDHHDLDLLARFTVHVLKKNGSRWTSGGDNEDLLQEVWIKIQRRYTSLDGADPRSYYAWVRKIARNTSIDDHRYRERRPSDPYDLEDLPLAAVSTPSFSSPVAASLTLSSLADEAHFTESDASLMRHLHEGHTLADVADLTDELGATIRGRAYRMRRRSKDVYDSPGKLLGREEA